MFRQPEKPAPRVDPESRLPLRPPLIVQQVRTAEDRTTFFGYAHNISRGGLFVGATNPKEVGNRFQLEFGVPEPFNETLRCTAEVVWRRIWSRSSPLQPGMGVRFLDLPEEDAQTVDRWIKESWRRKKIWGRGAPSSRTSRRG